MMIENAYQLQSEIGAVSLEIGGAIDLLRSFEMMYEAYNDSTKNLLKKNAFHLFEEYDETEAARLIRAHFYDSIDQSLKKLDDLCGILQGMKPPKAS